MCHLLCTQELPWQQQQGSQQPVLGERAGAPLHAARTHTQTTPVVTDLQKWERQPWPNSLIVNKQARPASPIKKKIGGGRKVLVEGNLGGVSWTWERSTGRRWSKDPRWSKWQVDGRTSCRPGHRTPGERYVTAGDTTFPSPEAAPLRFHAKAAADSPSSGQRLLRCQQLCGARPPPGALGALPRTGARAGVGEDRVPPGGRVSPLPAGMFRRWAAAVA